ncbi:hypothetical protein PG984_011549 [Apiospora sp. TS-2023a]
MDARDKEQPGLEVAHHQAPELSDFGADGLQVNQNVPTTTITSAGTAITSAGTAITSAVITTASKSTSSTPFPTTGILPLDCPNIDGTQKRYTVPGSTTTYTYRFACEQDALGSLGDGNFWNTTSLDGCVSKCTEQDYNESYTSCGGVVWNGNLPAALTQGGNCYLKMGTLSLHPCPGCVAVTATLVQLKPEGGSRGSK